MAQKTSTVLLRGGLNIVTPAIAVPPGQCSGAVNYEPEVRGYRRVVGYERYDGQGRPSQASYWVLKFDAGVAAITEGDTVTGATSSATGKALIDAVVESGSYGGSDAAGYLVLTDVSGTFQDNEDLQVSAATKSAANGTAAERGALTDANDTLWLKDAVETRRALIAKVPGSGAVRGVEVLSGSLYAIRDNAGATAGVLHKATSSGWVAQDLGHHLEFTAGTTAFVEGEAVTGAVSTATATVRRVVLATGAWDGSGTGFLVLSGITGTFQAESITGSGSGAATSAGAQVANALPAGGRYDFTVHNFYGAAYQERLYGCQGEDYAFEWDGTYFTPIRTGLSASLDKPTRVGHFANHLFLGYESGTVQVSEIGVPTQHKTTGGAMSLDFGSPITDFVDETATVLIVMGRRQIGYISGTSSANFVLSEVTHDSGAVGWTSQAAGSPMYLDDSGVRRMSTTEAFGNWRLGTITQQIEPFFKNKQAVGANARASIRVRARDQYRLFFDDKSGITIYLGRNPPEVLPFELGHTVYCSGVGEIGSEDTESLFVGTDDGYVMELDRGRSFDSAKITAWVRLAFNNVGSPTQKKRFSKATLECDASPTASLSIIPEFAYGDPYQPAGIEETFSIASGGGFWDEANWNEFYWSAQVVGQAEAYVDGIGQNISVVIFSQTDFEEPHTLSSLTLNFSYRGLIR